MDRRKRLLQAAKDRIALRANPFVLALTAALVFGIFLTRPFISPGLSISMLYAIPVALVGFWVVIQRVEAGSHHSGHLYRIDLCEFDLGSYGHPPK
jgi:hypothetical protein